MKLFIDINKEKINKNCAICLGNFDGLHLGHNKLLKEFNKLSRNLNKLIITFKPHPAVYVRGEEFKLIVSDYSDRVSSLKNYKPDYILLQNFNEDFKNILPEEFLNLLKKNFNMKLLVVGRDFNFGKNRKAGIDFLISMQEKYNFKLIIVNDFKDNNKKISSSYIRKLLLLGEIELANKYLYNTFYIKGFVIPGRMMGRKLGFPTANLKEYTSNQIIPRNGAYITKTYIEEKEYKSITNIGTVPSFEDVKFSIETHIINFNQDIYYKKIKIEFLKRIRDEKKFSSIDELKKRLEEDKKLALSFDY